MLYFLESKSDLSFEILIDLCPLKTSYLFLSIYNEARVTVSIEFDFPFYPTTFLFDLFFISNFILRRLIGLRSAAKAPVAEDFLGNYA